MIKKIPFFLLLIMSAVVLDSCHERGCTNASAINYNVTADQDDGSCIFCNTTITLMDSTTLYLIDQNFGSIHANDTVARFYLEQDIFTPSDKVCGKATCTISLVAESMINENMYLLYELGNVTGPLFINDSRNISLASHSKGSKYIIESFNNPPFTPMGIDSLLVTYQEIDYY